MGLFDNLSSVLKGALGQSETAQLPDLLSQVLARTDLGSMSGLLSRLQEGGLGAQVASWLSNGTNLPVSPEQLRSALGGGQLEQIARAAGLPVDNLVGMLSQHLPQTIDTISPNGALQEPQETEQEQPEQETEQPEQEQPENQEGGLENQAGLRDIRG